MRISIISMFALLFIFGECATFYRGTNNGGDVQLSRSFRVIGDGEAVFDNFSGQDDENEEENPFFQLEAMKIARAYLDKQYAKERAARN